MPVCVHWIGDTRFWAHINTVHYTTDNTNLIFNWSAFSCSMFTMVYPSTWLICVAAVTINVSDHQYEATLSCDGQGHALLTVPLLLQDLLRGTYFQFLAGTPTRILLFVVNSKLTYFPHQIDYRICTAYNVFIVLSVRRCWAPVEWRHSKLLWWWWMMLSLLIKGYTWIYIDLQRAQVRSQILCNHDRILSFNEA